MNSSSCPRCHAQVPLTSLHCSNCGQSLESCWENTLICPLCEKSFPPGTSFCDVDHTELKPFKDFVPTCKLCGRMYSPKTKFCPMDGEPLALPAYGLDSTRVPETIKETKYPKAPLGARFLASLLDGLLMLLMLVPVFLFGWIAISEFEVNNYSSSFSFFGGNRLISVLSMFLAFFFFCLIGVYKLFKDGMKNGQSFGKRALGLMVIYLPTNSPCNYKQSLLRNIVLQALEWVFYIGWVIEPIMVLANDDGRRLGDLAAKTQVIKTDEYLPQ